MSHPHHPSRTRLIATIAAVVGGVAMTPAVASATGNHDQPRPPKPTCGTTQTCPPGTPGQNGAPGAPGAPGVGYDCTGAPVLPGQTPATCPGQTVYVPVPVPVEKVCTSRRVITHRVAQTLFGREVIGVRANSPGYNTSVRLVDGRYVVSVDVRGEKFTGFNNNVRTRVVVRLGRKAGTTRPIARTGWWRTVYKADTCRSRKGAADQNDASSRTPLIPVPGNAVSAFLAR